MTSHAFIALDAAQALAACGSVADRIAVQVVDSCASTNTELLQSTTADNLYPVQVLAAEQQTQGRGRRGKTWFSPPGDGLTFSLRWAMPHAPFLPDGLSLAVGVALARAVQQYLPQPIQLKWPNDVLVEKQKLAGILIELRPAGSRHTAAVIGIGLNVTMPSQAGAPVLSQPVAALSQYVMPVPDRNILLGQILRQLLPLLDDFNQRGFACCHAEWQQRNAFCGQPVQVTGEQSQLSGICTGVDHSGALQLHTQNGLCRIVSGDVSLRPMP